MSLATEDTHLATEENTHMEMPTGILMRIVLIRTGIIIPTGITVIVTND